MTAKGALQRPWSEAERAELRRCWLTPGWSVQGIADWLGRSRTAVAVAASEFGLGPRPPAVAVVEAAPPPGNRPPLGVGACLDVTLLGPEWGSAEFARDYDSPAGQGGVAPRLGSVT